MNGYVRREDRHDGPAPEVQLRLSLELLRAQGEPFDAAWPVALDAVRWLSARERKELLPVLCDLLVREAFHRAYVGRPHPEAQRVAELIGAWDCLAPAIGEDPADVTVEVAA